MGSMQMLQGWCCCAPSALAILPYVGGAGKGGEGRGGERSREPVRRTGGNPSGSQASFREKNDEKNLCRQLL
ncbi:unnamed protein product [Miscanthus lutarioriparius]|uniref:Secreted protein n=1 Tax=Miscanthus lutarioriparius TaxID=422564 RepID=A0A811PS56_9POAL|nr:unnamed protein product [Miscanthus lutarioriparius]